MNSQPHIIQCTEELNTQEKGALVWSIAVSLLTSDTVDPFCEVAKISYEMLLMLSKILRL